MVTRDRDDEGRPRQARPRDELGRPLPYGAVGVEPVSEDPLPPRETVRFALELLDQGRPFSAHEVFEARWKDSPEAERDLWQGLAQLSVGLTHALRGNEPGAQRLLERGDGRLERYSAAGGPTYGLDLADLRARISAWPGQTDIAAREGATTAPGDDLHVDAAPGSCGRGGEVLASEDGASCRRGGSPWPARASTRGRSRRAARGTGGPASSGPNPQRGVNGDRIDAGAVHGA